MLQHKFIITLILFSLISCESGKNNASIQDIKYRNSGYIWYVDEFGNGEWIKKVPEGHFDPGTGSVTFFYDNGNKQRTIPFSGNIKHGNDSTFYESGELHAVGHWDKNRKHGLCIIYSPSGVLLDSSNFENNEIHGLRTQYYRNGSDSLFTNWKHGLQHGQTTSWWPNGNIEGSGIFKNDNPDSIYCTYYKNGALKSQISHADGIMKGKYLSFFPNGQKKLISSRYGRDIIDDTIQMFYPSGAKLCFGIYDKGMRVIPSKIYYESGELWGILSDTNQIILSKKGIQIDTTINPYQILAKSQWEQFKHLE